jgi:signal transduction histidine kinase
MSTKPLTFRASIDLAEFISVQAHDLRSPFNQTVGFSKIILNGQDGTLTDLQREDLTTVYRSSLRALTLINGLIDIARLERGEKSATPAPLDWAVVVEQATAQWKKFYGARTIDIATQFDPAASTIIADEIQLKQIIAGLMALVAEFISDPGQIQIRVEHEPGWRVVSISSEGPRTDQQSSLDTDLLGYVGQALIGLNRGLLRAALETDTGAIVRFALPDSDGEADRPFTDGHPAASPG